MKKFNFTLQKVFEYNTHLQKKEKDTLSEMQNEYDKLCKKMKSLKEKFNDYKNQQLEACIEGTCIINLIIFNTYLSGLQTQMLILKNDMLTAEAKIEKQIQILLSVTKEKTSLEKLREKHLVEYNSVERKHNELFIDEFVANRASK